MKKYFKTQLKKSISLLMAVLMLLSCWVWVAPTQAEAADKEAGQYDVRLVAKSSDDGQVTAVSCKVYYDGGSVSLTGYPDNLKNGGTASGYTLLAAAGVLPAFPTKFEMSITIDGCNGHKNGTYFFQLEVYNNDTGAWVKVNNDPSSGIGWSNFKDGKSIGTDDGRTHTMDSVKPTATTVKNSSGNMESKTMPDIPKVGATNEESVACTAAGVYDQYGVKLTSLTPGYYVSTNSAGTDTCESDNTKENYMGVWASNNTVKANADVQTKLTNTTGSQKVYLIATYETLKAAVSEITLNYPKYKVTVDPNGSISDLAAPMDMSDGSTQTTTWSDEGYYSLSANKYPKGTAGKEGYTFKGFWTTSQPTSGAAHYTATEADFANPTDTTTFDTYKAQDGAVLSENNLVVTLADGSKYYNAGRQWDANKDKQFLGDNAFYGWWISQDIPVKFYDIDGKYLGSQTAKYGDTPRESWYPDPKDSYSAGAFEYQTFAKQWRDITGAVITEGSYKFGDLDSLTLTPIYTNKTYNDNYTVKFINPGTGSAQSNTYDYRYILEGDDIPNGNDVETPATLANDVAYTYEFAGWSSQKPSSGNYHVISEDDTAFAVNTDWVVRNEITYYAVYRSTIKYYNIAFSYTDSTGKKVTKTEKIPYGSIIVTPDYVNRTYATGGYGFNLEAWTYYDSNNKAASLNVDESLVFDETKIFITEENLADYVGGKPIYFAAVYDEGAPMPYNITFKYKDANGVDKVVTAEVNHGKNITQDTVDKLTVPEKYDDGSALYTFANMWKVIEGTADKAEYTTDELTSFSPTSHVTFEAVYGEGVPFYTVTYHHGAATYRERVLKGSNVPAWTVATGEEDEMDEYVPADYKSETGTYKFAGWFDAEQTDETFAETNGTKYTTESIVNSNLDLYAQFKFEPFKFIIKFMDYSGKVQLAIAEVEAGQSYEAAFVEAQRAAQYRAPDDTYTYTFVGWDYPVPGNYLCEGKDMTYTAQYRADYIYYKANWYNSADVIGTDEPLATTNHTYNGAVYAPSVELEVPDGKVFDGWYYSKDGVETAYQRGMIITADMNFYAKYKDAPVVYTVTTVIDDVETEYKVAAGDTAKVVGRPLDGYVDENNHNKFGGWYTTADYSEGTEFNIDTEINENKTIYAKFTVTAHSKDQKELISAPTYYAKGSEKVWCACSKDDTIETIEIPMLTDKVAPTGTIYLGTQGKWSSTDEVGAAATDDEDPSLYANADTDIILAINDTGDVNNAYNPNGVGKGIKTIRGIISTGVFGAGTTEIAGIKTIFSVAENDEELNNVANYVIRLGDYEGLVDGETYIAYYYVMDKAGNELNKNVRTAKFIYDITAPEFTITGDSNEGTGTSTVTYCGKATVTGIEEGATVTVNDTEVTATNGEYVIDKAGNYIITVTDKAGNSYSKKIIVAEGHDEVTTEKPVSCTEDGYKKVICAVCAKVIENETIETEGHKYGDVVTVAPTCTDKGYDVRVCSVCGCEEKTNEVPAAGHKHNKDADGNIVYVVLTPATCKTEGKKISNCTVCGKDTKTETIPVDTVNGHKYGSVKTLKATCTDDGEEYQNCKYCFEKVTVKILDKLNHVDTGRYTKITTEATCYSEGVETTYCKACDTVMGTAPVDKIAHTLILVKYEGANNDDVANYPNGYMQYECQVDGCTHTEGKTAIKVKATYTVTFVGVENGTFTKTEGESVAADAVYSKDDAGKYILPTKASDNEYNYTFAGWKAASTGKVVQLPVKVTKNETYTAEFTATDRIYTHIFQVPESYGSLTYSTYKTIVGRYGDENKVPEAIPELKKSDMYEYEFIKWVKVGAAAVAEGDEVVNDEFTMTADATFQATFKQIPLNYTVVYLNGTAVLQKSSVAAGDEVPEYAGEDPTKAFDSQYHYAFSGWSVDDDTVVTSDLYIQPVFTATKHTYDRENGVVTTAPTCTKTGVIEYTCTGCAKKTTDSVAATGIHNMVDGKCTSCGFEESITTVTITFKDDRGTIYSETVVPGTTVTYAVVPTKDSTDEFNYTFAGWVKGDEAPAKLTEFTVDSDVVYTAKFTATTRTYTVTYYNEGNPVAKYEDVEYNAYIPGYTSTPTKAFTSSYHFDFLGWSVNNGPTYTLADVEAQRITGDTAIYARYATTPHTLAEENRVDGTCSRPAYIPCSYCDYEFEIPGATANAHTPKADTVVIKEATFDETGTKKFYCTSCEQTVEEILPVKEHLFINIKVYNDDGTPADYANVKLKYDGEIYELYENGKETEDGFVSFKVDKSLNKKLWSAYIVADGIAGGAGGAVKTATSINGTLNEFNKPDTSGEGTETPDDPKPEEPDSNKCSCSCHKNTFWGMLFRFFQKIIRFFGGKDCCADPRR